MKKVILIPILILSTLKSRYWYWYDTFQFMNFDTDTIPRRYFSLKISDFRYRYDSIGDLCCLLFSEVLCKQTGRKAVREDNYFIAKERKIKISASIALLVYQFEGKCNCLLVTHSLSWDLFDLHRGAVAGIRSSAVIFIATFHANLRLGESPDNWSNCQSFDSAKIERALPKWDHIRVNPANKSFNQNILRENCTKRPVQLIP